MADGYGVSGYDPVAYHTEGQPTVGNDAYTASHEGVTYRFASADNKNAFQTNPEKYAPEYGGFCAFGTAMGRKFPGDPNAWEGTAVVFEGPEDYHQRINDPELPIDEVIVIWQRGVAAVDPEGPAIPHRGLLGRQ